MTYQETIDFLFSQLAMYQAVGPSAYKPGLDTTVALDSLFGSPSKKIPAIHVAGTNGKGSTSHSLAAVLQSAGLKTGLYTSPHLLDFRERIRINGRMIPEDEVVRFVERYRQTGTSLKPSFFELSTIMAFDWMARSGVDVAVIETGLGGRLDSTNIITPLLSVITNISLDHMAMLGDTPEAIAAEKAGIIKDGVPVVVGEAHDHGVREVFEHRAVLTGSPIEFASDTVMFSHYSDDGRGISYYDTPYGDIRCDLSGSFQPANMNTVLHALRHLPVGPDAVRAGLSSVASLTGLMGRWMTVSEHPTVICDTGHNIGAWEYLAPRIALVAGPKQIVLGFVNDKDTSPVLKLAAAIPDATFYFTRASVARALPAEELASRAGSEGIAGHVCPSVADAFKAATAAAGEDGFVYVGGSTFVVADLLACLQR